MKKNHFLKKGQNIKENLFKVKSNKFVQLVEKKLVFPELWHFSYLQMGGTRQRRTCNKKNQEGEDKSDHMGVQRNKRNIICKANCVLECLSDISPTPNVQGKGHGTIL